jgi:hypothetical protein
MATATKQSLYINQNGMVCCIQHGGSYLNSEYTHAPELRFYTTPLDSWEQMDSDFVAEWIVEVGVAPKCEMCR